ncbi:MAG: hypothetical protein JNK76_14950 [Planctomycetales bacterium]|nr:hypothetical protein [Planctomycetales bacterium]MBN8628971.1 hypothetical protein [Planctomycetota bacterium]
MPHDAPGETAEGSRAAVAPQAASSGSAPGCRPACPVCGGRLIDIRAKLQCSQCHRIVETCCEGGLEG